MKLKQVATYALTLLLWVYSLTILTILTGCVPFTKSDTVQLVTSTAVLSSLKKRVGLDLGNLHIRYANRQHLMSDRDKAVLSNALTKMTDLNTFITAVPSDRSKTATVISLATFEQTLNTIREVYQEGKRTDYIKKHGNAPALLAIDKRLTLAYKHLRVVQRQTSGRLDITGQVQGLITILSDSDSALIATRP